MSKFTEAIKGTGKVLKAGGKKVASGGKKVAKFCKDNPDVAITIGMLAFYGGIIGLSIYVSNKEEKEAKEAYEKAQKELNDIWEKKYKDNYEAFKAFAEEFKIEPGQVLCLGFNQPEDGPPEHVVFQEIIVPDLGQITMKEYI